MNFKKTIFALAIGSVGIMGAMSAHAFTLANGDVLNITAGAPTFTTSGAVQNVPTGSWFGMDTNGSSTITGGEKTPLSALLSPGITIGATTTAGPYGDNTTIGLAGPIVDTWGFYDAGGTNFNTVGITGSTEGGLNFSGWAVAWNNVPFIDMGQNAWGAGYTSGIANFQWDGVYGSTYTLDYHAAVPSDSPAFPNVKYALHLEGTVVQAVPEASTYGMMLAGLGLVGFAVRRRKSAI